MKRLLTVLILLLLTLASCTIVPESSSIWHSDEPEMTLFFLYEYEANAPYGGEVVLDGEYHDVYFIRRPSLGSMILELVDRVRENEDGHHITIMSGICYHPFFNKNKIRYSIDEEYQETTGYKTIYLTKVADTYEEFLAKKEGGELD